MSWLVLILAGLCEIVWALGLKFSNGLTKPIESAVTIFFMIFSLYLLAVASREIPIGLSYTVWVGIGSIGAFVGNIVLFQEKASSVQIFFFTVIVVGILGLKLSSLKR